MSKILVTGGAGFIGSHVVDRLVADGHEVVVIDNLSTGDKNFVNPKAIFHEQDICEWEKIAPLFKGIEAVFHLAADPRLQMSIDHPLKTHATNVTGTVNVLWAAKQAGVKKVLFASSCTVYGDCPTIPLSEADCGNPMSPYGLHELMGEQYMRLFSSLFGLPTLCLRLFNVYGPRKKAGGAYPMVIPIFIQQKRNGEALTVVGDGEQTRDYVHVSDVVEAFMLAWQSPFADGRAINIAEGRQRSVNEIAALVGGAVEHISSRVGEMRFVEANTMAARELLTWKPKLRFEDGIRQLL